MSFDCATCFACCLYERHLPIDQAKVEGRRLNESLMDAADLAAKALPADYEQPCIWLVIEQDSIDDGPCGKCLHYEQRPKCCRDFTKGGEACLAAREYKEQATGQA